MSTVDNSQRDDLSGLLKYEAFVQTLGKELAEAEKSAVAVSVALVDIDYFKAVNDEHGRQVGDDLLKRLAEHLSLCAANLGTVFRYGGDELAVVLPGIEKEQAFLCMEEARVGFGRQAGMAGAGTAAKLPVTISVGVACYPEDGAQSQELLRKACDAIHRAKVARGNRVCLAREERMVTKTSHYTQAQLQRLGALAQREGVGEAVLLREALDELLRKNDV